MTTGQSSTTGTTDTITAARPIAGRELEDLIRTHLPLVNYLVREMLGRVPSHVNRDDLSSAGMAALLSAAQSFDPERGTPFPRFAATRIRGALLDELRGLDWASRSVRHRARKAETAWQQLTTALGRTPTNTELAAALGVAVDEVDSVAQDVQRAVVLSLQGFPAGTGEEIVAETGAGPEEILLHRERVGYLYHAVEALPERLRIVVQKYFLEDTPMAQIADELGVTESRVSQLRAEALSLMKDGMNTQLDPGLVDQPERPEGCVARRRATYYAKVAAVGDLNTRLAMTTPLGMPMAASA
jgi:RNA polymerase sigma factor for flagellar operon FliA